MIHNCQGDESVGSFPGEQWLDRWMDKNARVYWIEDDEPWVLEEMLIATISLPLNLQGNKHTFKPILSSMRSKAIAEAQTM
ncbi:GIY-YIG nuclease family protein, partial [Klebsiella pneumoniae]